MQIIPKDVKEKARKSDISDRKFDKDGQIKSKDAKQEGTTNMRINKNMSAIIANKQLLRTENRLAASVERLSSGFKINKAGDNPAGMAISNKMKAQIDAIDQAEDNASNGIAVLQIADGALNEVTSMLQRMRELSVQAANGTNEYDERLSIQKEIDKLKEEVDRISSDTEYNTKTLLDGSSDVRVYAEGISRVYVSDAVTEATYQLEVVETGKQAEVGASYPGGTAGTIEVNGSFMEVTANMDQENFFAALRETAEKGDCVLEKDGTDLKILSSRYGSSAEVSLKVSKNLAEAMGIADLDGVTYNEETGDYEYLVEGKDAVVNFPNPRDNSNFSDTATIETDGNRVIVTDKDGFEMDFLMDADYPVGETMEIEVTDIGPMTIQIGANQYQSIEVRIPELSMNSMYLDTIDVTPKGGAERAMVTLDEAIHKLSSVRSGIGAFQNRLEYAAASLAETEENMTGAYSNIMDTDMAAEMTEYTQQNVLDQAAISVLSQANDMPQQILSLLQ